jgi:hypothetical protein
MWAVASDVLATLLQARCFGKLKIFRGHQSIQCATTATSGTIGYSVNPLAAAKRRGAFLLEAMVFLAHIPGARAHGMWTYEPRQGRKAATVVCSTSAVVTLACSFTILIYDLRFEKIPPLGAQS